MASEANKIFNPELWVQKYGDDLFSWAYHRTGKKVTAEDLVQETFLWALSTPENFEGHSSEKIWLFSILKNKIADYFRRAFVNYEMDESNMQHDHKDASFLRHFFDRYGGWNKNTKPSNWHEDEDSLADDEEFRTILKMCMRNLPENWLAIIHLKFLENRKTPEVCKELGITPSDLWVMMHRAKLQLRECIENNFLD